VATTAAIVNGVVWSLPFPHRVEQHLLKCKYLKSLSQSFKRINH